MSILGVYEGHNAGAALISERSGEVLAVVEEERLSRIKNHDSRPGAGALPMQSIRWCLEQAHAAGEPVKTIAIGLMAPELLQDRAWSNFMAAVTGGEGQRMRRAEELGLDEWAFSQMPHVSQSDRVARALEAVRSAGYDPESVPHHLVEHHRCHAASFFLTPARTALVVTLDGKGDDLSGSLWQGCGTQLRSLAMIPTEDSLGHFYSAATVACGLRPQRDEGKLMALAAHGKLHPSLYVQLSDLVSFDGDTGRLTSNLSVGIVQGPYPDRVASFHNDRMAQLIKGIERADVAFTVQQVLEEVVVSLVRHYLGATGESTLVVAGGVFANVSLNRRLAQMEDIHELHVHPGMTDSGIAMGAAAWVYALRQRRRPVPLEQLALGPAFASGEAARPFLELGYERAADAARPEMYLARALARGEIVARFVGGCEYGPRALGCRSVLAPAHSRRLLRDLNVRLGRSQIMPFAPIVLAEWASVLFADWEAAQNPMRFMTTAVACTDRALQEIPAAVHRDGTARPQLVEPGREPALTELLIEYHRLSGRMGLVNTSFNLHDEPIVCTPEDAARSASVARINVVQVGSEVLVRRTSDAAP